MTPQYALEDCPFVEKALRVSSPRGNEGGWGSASTGSAWYTPGMIRAAAHPLAKAVLICGAGHSGSTLLGLILGSHSACFYSGEAGKVRYLGDARKPLRKRVCKLCGEGCPVWSDFTWDRDLPLYVQIARATGSPVVVDSTKSIPWIHERLAELEASGITAALIFLARDGRAVINSRIRKYPDRPPAELIGAWARQIGESRRLYEAYGGPRCRVSYEELASAPDDAVRRLCGRLDLDFEPAMLAFDHHEHHPLGGNNGTQYLVARSRFADPGEAFVALPERSRDYYAGHAKAIALDLRWRRELDPKHLELFEELAGDVNRELRWES